MMMMIHALQQHYDDPQLINYPVNLIPNDASPAWMNKSDNAWQMIAATMVGLQSVPGLIILYGSMVKKKWAVNSAFMALYAFAAVLVCWVLWGHRMSFGDELLPFMAKPNASLSQIYLLEQAPNGDIPMAVYVFYEFVFAAITVILLAGSVLGRMNFYAWMIFVPLWLTFSYTIGAHAIWGIDGFLERKGLLDFSGGYVIHLSSGIAGFTAAFWVGPRLHEDRQKFPPNNIIHMLGGAGFLWLGWTGFNGGSPCEANLVASLAVLNTHLCTATSLLVWLGMDMIFYKKSSVIGAVQGMITGLVCITPGAGIVASWAAVVMGVLSGLLPWYTMMVLHKRLAFFQKVDDTLAVFHTHAVAGALGGLLSGLFAKPSLVKMFYNDTVKYGPGLVYCFIEGHYTKGLQQLGVQFLGALFVTVWNIVITSAICLLISQFVALRMEDEELRIGDDAVHGEEAYALWGDGEKNLPYIPRLSRTPKIPDFCGCWIWKIPVLSLS